MAKKVIVIGAGLGGISAAISLAAKGFSVEVYEKNDKFVMRAELPGMKKEKMDVSVVGDTLTIGGERKAESEVKDDGYHCWELFLREVFSLHWLARSGKY